MREATTATIYTQSNSKGATVNDSGTNEPTVMLNIDDIVNYEQTAKMENPRSQVNMQAMIEALKKGQNTYVFENQVRKIGPIMVREVNNLRGVSNPRWNDKTMTSPGGIANSQYKYQVVDGHHRYRAYKAAGFKQVPAIIIAPENIRREKLWTPDS